MRGPASVGSPEWSRRRRRRSNEQERASKRERRAESEGDGGYHIIAASWGLLPSCGAQRKARGEEESGGGKNVISPLISLLNRLQPVRSVLLPHFTEPECLLTKCSKVGVRQQRTITLDVQQIIVPCYYYEMVLFAARYYRSKLKMNSALSMLVVYCFFRF